jgi:hypothetical protein
MKLVFSENARKDYLYWQKTDEKSFQLDCHHTTKPQKREETHGFLPL